MKHLTTLFLLALSLLHGAVYEVGPGKQFTDPVALPWGQLTDGDTIKVYWRDEPYRNLFFIGWSNFSLIGVSGPQGQKPIIDGDGATAITRGISYYNHDRGLVRIGESDVPKVKYLENILVEGFEFRNAWRTNATADKPANRGYHGQDTPNANQPWADNASGVQATGVKNITIRNNIFHEMKIGISIFGSYPNRVSTNCVVENNEFYTIGSDDQSHVLYLECNGEIIRNNKSTQQPGWSSVFKTRGICTWILNNWIVGGDRVVDLVDSFNMRNLFGQSCPDIVANNFITRENANDNNAYIHFGGDSSNLEGYRKNTLYVLNNTIDTNRTLGNILVRTSAWTQNVVVLNNVFQWKRMARYGFLLGDWNEYRKTGPNAERSKISYGNNWFQAGSCPDKVSVLFLCGLIGPLDVTDLGNNLWVKSSGDEDKPPSKGPGWDSNYYPTATSPLLDGGVTPVLPGVDWTFGGTRAVVGKAIDIGAFEAGTNDRPGIQTGGSFVVTPPPTTTTTTTIPPASTTTSTAPASTTTTSFEQSLTQLKALVTNATKAKKTADDATAAAQAAITEAKAAAARAEYDVTTAGEQYVQQIKKVLQDAGFQ